MARKVKNRIINDVEYSVTQMDAVDAFKNQCYIAKILTPLLSNAGNLTLNDALSKVLPTIIDKVAEDDKFHSFFIGMCEQALNSTKDSRVSFNRDFEDNLKSAYQVFLFVLEVNYADFIKDVFGVDLSKIITASMSQTKKAT